jgi:hypothetical protein
MRLAAYSVYSSVVQVVPVLTKIVGAVKKLLIPPARLQRLTIEKVR